MNLNPSPLSILPGAGVRSVLAAVEKSRRFHAKLESDLRKLEALKRANPIESLLSRPVPLSLTVAPKEFC